MPTMKHIHALIAHDVEDLLLRGEGNTRIVAVPVKQRSRMSLRKKMRRAKHTARLTAILAAAITEPIHDPGRTDKTDFSNATTAPAIAK